MSLLSVPKSFVSLVFAGLISLMFFSACGQPADDREILEKSIGLFQRFQDKLKEELLAAIAAGGPAGAIETCRMVSPRIENEMGEEHALIRFLRVSDRFRNPAHAPDAFETRVLEDWQTELARARQDGRSDFVPEPVIEHSSEGVRVMAPIVIQGALCLQCHGQAEQIAPETRDRLRELYPDDRAVGYAVGDLRGAFSAIWADRR
ncbi:MAG: DUF3365 domain-containing protein [Spirochaetales bacterium]|nr:DUF3365 domain-containing protein [Leptospiraceae bacterium]MCP5483149.1 DUF3365 domain-containing protein [Spirochaetales bacterium]MCP5484589.1 DUF3365 domain-containing protein [Spirochaetales bacterium]